MNKFFLFFFITTLSFGQWQNLQNPNGGLISWGEVQIGNNSLNVLPALNTSIGWATTDKSVGYSNSQTVANYGMTINKFVGNNITAPTVSLAGFGGLRFYTSAVERIKINEYGNVGIGESNPTSKLDVNGEIEALAIKGPSDFRYKKNIIPLENALAKVLLLNGYKYEWRKEEFPNKNFKNGKDIGLIAQEVEKVFPEVVYTDADEMKSKSIDYTKLVPILVESIKELKIEIEALKTLLNQKK